jgi:hypothetical protein
MTGVTPYARRMVRSDRPASPGGRLRRRRAKRKLEHLAEGSERTVSPRTAKAHVRIIEDQTAFKDREPEGQVPDAPAELSAESRPGGFHVRPVPIDQPFGEAQVLIGWTAAIGARMRILLRSAKSWDLIAGRW